MIRTLIFSLMLALLLAACGGATDSGSGNANDAQGLLDSGQTSLDAGNYNEAVRDLEASVQAQPSLIGYFELGNAYTQLGRFNDAQKAYEEGLKINPNHAATLSNLGVALYQQGLLSEAQERFEQSLRLEPNDAATRYLLGATFMQQNNLDAAEEQFQEALRIQPDLAEAHYGMAVLYRERGMIAEAIAELEAFLTGPPAQDPRARTEAENLLRQLRAQ